MNRVGVVFLAALCALTRRRTALTPVSGSQNGTSVAMDWYATERSFTT